jgi:hypothetical protein
VKNLLGSGSSHHDEIVWQSASGGVRHTSIWEMGDNFNFVRHDLTTEPDAKWQIIGIGDFDGDGQNGLIWRKSDSGELQTWTLDSNVHATIGPDIGRAKDNWYLGGIGDMATAPTILCTQIMRPARTSST